MKFEELSAIWNSTDHDLEKSVSINKELVKELGVIKVKNQLYEIKWISFIGLFVGLIFLVFIGRFIHSNFWDVKFSLPAFVLLISTLFSLGMEMYKLFLFYAIEPEGAVMETQKKLAKLRKLEILDSYSLYLLIPLLSAPFLIVLAKAWLGINLYAFGAAWLASYIAGSFVVAVIIVFFLKKYPNKNLTASMAFLRELEENDK